MNSIMRKFQKTGSMDHAKVYQGQYGFTTGQSLQQALNTVQHAETMFDALPSSIRNKFENQPSAFFDYVQDPANAAEASELGISLAPEAAKAAKEAADAASPPTAEIAAAPVDPAPAIDAVELPK